MDKVEKMREEAALRRRMAQIGRVIEAHGRREGTFWHQPSLPAPWRWCSDDLGTFHAGTGLVYVVAAADPYTGLTIHAGHTRAEALTGSHHEPVAVDIEGKGSRGIGLAFTAALRELEHIERTVGLDRGLAV